MRHELKIWPAYFDAVIDGNKTWELRKNDRPFAVGDSLWLREYHPSSESYTGRDCEMTICGVLGDLPMLQEGYVLLSIHACVEWQIRGRHHYEWRKTTEALAAEMHRVNPLHVRAVTVVTGAVPKGGV